MLNKHLIVSAATAGLFALAPAPLRAADEEATATAEVAKEESIQKIRLAIKAAKVLLKENIKAARQVAKKKARRKAAGKARFLRRLLEEDSTTLKADASTKGAFKTVRDEKFVDADTETEKQKEIGNDLEDCLDRKDLDLKKCMETVETDSEDLKSVVADKKERMEEVIARKELDGFQPL